MSGRLSGKVAIITGSSRGIGRAVALRFAREGAKIVCNYVSQSIKADEVVRQIKSIGGEAVAVKADVSSKEDAKLLVETAINNFGKLDILVNNAGIFIKGGIFDDTVIFDRLIDVNVKGVINCTAMAARVMMNQRHGRIINVSSIAGIGTSARNTTYYAISKAAVILLTKRLALELGEYGITVNAVAPGLILTDMVETQSEEDRENIMRLALEKSVLRKVGSPDDVASLITYLATDEAGFITGQVITIDGGRIDFLSRSC
ncbi:MAG: 3-oxoacyl-ACP reductase family protein [Nitrososphaerota archaeon]